MLIRALVAVSSSALRRRLLRLLRLPHTFAVARAGREDLWDLLRRENADLVVVGRELLQESPAIGVAALRNLPERPDVIVVSGAEDASDRAALLSAGCLAVLFQGLPDATLQETLSALVERRREASLPRLSPPDREDGFRISDFVSRSPAMQGFLAVVRRVAASDSSILILGETGVGKEHLARGIHAEGPRARGPFIAVNCGALPEALLESELFGHEMGAFTGALRAHRGYFELAHGGTIFLDEIGEMAPHLQVKLLRAIQEHAIQRVGGEQAISVDVRILAATNRDLAQEIREKRFRSDLYYRLSVVNLTIPPLRERREDIPMIIESYLEHFRARLKRPITGIAPGALETLVTYSWPGNVRELINVIERAVLLAPGPEVTFEDLPEGIRRAGSEAAEPQGAAGGKPQPPSQGAPGGERALALPPGILSLPFEGARDSLLRAFEEEYFRRLLAEAGGRVGLAARRAGINPRSLYTKMRHLGLRKEAFRPEGTPPLSSV